MSEVESKVKAAVQACRKVGLRRTAALEQLLRELVVARKPLSLGDISELPGMCDLCDKATVYRLLVRLERKGIVRRLGLHERSAYYTILFPGEHEDYLICTDCGSIETVDMACPVEALEQEVMEETGYSGIYHELEFFGRCPACSSA